ncbi:hypothetical protein F5B19DRAFT_334771 [Rostrohypoxylon terebratum]|nr:hypothetical protein F5B19DRAFT_334771 [Rostrohypoxylon terebratum]
MYRYRIARLAYTTSLLASTVYAQELGLQSGGGWGGWIQNQANSTLCEWDALRVTPLKDVVYLDGGDQRFVAGMIDGTVTSPLLADDNPLGLVWTFNFSNSFDKNTNFSAILNIISKAPGGGAATNIAPNYHGGALLGNDDEFYLFGGTLMLTSKYSAPDGGSVLEYAASKYGDDNGRTFYQGFQNVDLPNDMTRYVTFGAAANAPSEQKAWYFGGYRSDSWGPIYQGVNSTYDPSTVSNTFISLDTSVQGGEVWNNVTLPPGTRSRANPSMVWVPVGEKGILVVIGGVTYPNYDNANQTSQNPAQSEKDSPEFMSTVDIYDIAGDKWYQQSTQGSPPALTKGCAVVATAQDKSSFNIYYYGGYNGLDLDADFNDDVWILSLPSFMWMQVSAGTASHARAGHQCVMPYPDQMITIGGRTSNKGNSENCLGVAGGGDTPSMLQAFNLTQAEWMDSYDPKSWNEYGVPQMIYMMIGGDYSGGATKTAPTPGGWATSALGNVFATPYDTKKITTYYPYSSVGPGNGTRGSASSGGGGKKGTPGWVGAVIGVVLGVALLTGVGVGICLYKKRRLFNKNNNVESDQSTTVGHTHKVNNWIQNLAGSKTPTTMGGGTQYGDPESRVASPQQQQSEIRNELPYSPLCELVGDSPHRGELASHSLATNPYTPHDITTPTNQLPLRSSTPRDHSSNIDSQEPPPQYTQRPDSPSLGNNSEQYGSLTGIATSKPNPSSSVYEIRPNSAGNIGHVDRPRTAGSNPNRGTMTSGVSGFSDREVAHLRQTSDSTVSSMHPDESHQGRFGQYSPPLIVSPPTADIIDNANDYVSRQHPQHPGNANLNSPSRQSAFIESEDDLGARRKEEQ